MSGILLALTVSAECSHQFSEWINRGDFLYRECMLCEDSETMDIPAHICVFGDEWHADASTHYQLCASCGGKGSASPHTFGDWATMVEPTTVTAGTRERSCSVCGHVQAAAVDPLPPDTSGTDETSTPETTPSPEPVTPPSAEIPDGGSSVSAGSVWENPFIDINKNHPYYHAVRFVCENNLFVGIETDEGLTFAPGMTMTRAMFVTVLGRLAGVDTTAYADMGMQFSDAKVGAWYTPYIAWAYAHGIIFGYDDGTFGVDDLITVEQAAVIMARFAEINKLHVFDASALTAQYRDAASVSLWAVEEVGWCISTGILTPDGNIKPQSPASRALVADMLRCYIEKFGKTGQ